ncbi:uncharacterized protein EDB91DRAFT_1086324 [Suillus paluster]|uniref:uncharacterized protein n=1 Tax=Suillus paluster TaxID=48578 RepID=UPI001B873D52|nr:uncharacterized protein EDB91DRAFT_1086324 [Suillus paluster]KAG1727658.1 hypothetical protein EDB91DRAFT_1086324 [Suillus paluster]
MVQDKPKVSTSKNTSSPSDFCAPSKPVTPKLVSAKTVLEKLQFQDGGFYVGTQNLARRVEYFQGGHEGLDSIKLVHHLFTPLKSTEGSEDQVAVDPEDDDTLTNTTADLTSDFEMTNWPVAECCKSQLADLVQTHTINPLPAYSLDRKLMPPAQYKSKLCGAVIEVHFAFFIITSEGLSITSSMLPLKQHKLGASPASDMPFNGKKWTHKEIDKYMTLVGQGCCRQSSAFIYHKPPYQQYSQHISSDLGKLNSLPKIEVYLILVAPCAVDRDRHSLPIYIILPAIGPLLIVLLNINRPLLAVLLNINNTLTGNSVVVPEVLRVLWDINVNVCSFPCPAINMGCKQTKLSTICHVKESVVQSMGDLRTLHSNLMRLQVDHIIYEREQLQSHTAANPTACQLLAEAALEAGTTNTDAHYFGDFDMDSNQDNMEEQDEHEEEEGDKGESEGNPVGGCEGSAVGTVWAQVIYWQMQDLVAAYLCWKLHEASDIPPVDPGSLSMSSISIPQAAEEPANVLLINVGLTGCSPIQPTIAISLKCLELYHQICRWKPSFSVQAMVKVPCALHNTHNFFWYLNLL